MVQIAIFGLLELPYLISHKIWVAGKCWIFNTVDWTLLIPSIVVKCHVTETALELRIRKLTTRGQLVGGDPLAWFFGSFQKHILTFACLIAILKQAWAEPVGHFHLLSYWGMKFGGVKGTVCEHLPWVAYWNKLTLDENLRFCKTCLKKIRKVQVLIMTH